MQLRSVLVSYAVAYTLSLGAGISFCPAGRADEAPQSAPSLNSTGQIDGVFIGSDPSAKFIRKASNVIGLGQGAIVVSVRDPAIAALVVTRLGRIKLKAGSSALVGITGDVLKVQNLQGPTDSVVIGLRKDLFGAAAASIVKLNAGQQITAVKPQSLPTATDNTGPSPTAATPATTTNATATSATTTSPIPPATPAAATSQASAPPVAQSPQKSGIAPVLIGAAFGGAGVCASAALISCIDKGIRNDQDRRRYREMIQASAFMDAWQTYNKDPNNRNSQDRNSSGRNDSRSRDNDSKSPKIDPPKPTEDQAKGMRDLEKSISDSEKKEAAESKASNSKQPDKSEFEKQTDDKKASDSKPPAKDELNLDDDKKDASAGKSAEPKAATDKAAADREFDLDDKKDTAPGKETATKGADTDKELDLDDKKDTASGGKNPSDGLNLADEKGGGTAGGGAPGDDPFSGLFGAASAAGAGTDTTSWFGEAAEKGAELTGGGGEVQGSVDGLFSPAEAQVDLDVLKGADSAMEMPDIPLPDVGGAIMDAVPTDIGD